MPIEKYLFFEIRFLNILEANLFIQNSFVIRDQRLVCKSSKSDTANTSLSLLYCNTLTLNFKIHTTIHALME